MLVPPDTSLRYLQDLFQAYTATDEYLRDVLGKEAEPLRVLVELEARLARVWEFEEEAPGIVRLPLSRLEANLILKLLEPEYLQSPDSYILGELYTGISALLEDLSIYPEAYIDPVLSRLIEGRRLNGRTIPVESLPDEYTVIATGLVGRKVLDLLPSWGGLSRGECLLARTSAPLPPLNSCYLLGLPEDGLALPLTREEAWTIYQAMPRLEEEPEAAFSPCEHSA